MEALDVEEGSLYPALNRMLLKGWLNAERGTSESDRKAGFHRLTRDGRKQLAAETTAFNQVVAAIQPMMKTAWCTGRASCCRRRNTDRCLSLFCHSRCSLFPESARRIQPLFWPTLAFSAELLTSQTVAPAVRALRVDPIDGVAV